MSKNNGNGCASRRVQRFYDVCMVRAFEVQGFRFVEGDCGELVDRVRGVLFSGAGEPNRFLPLYDGAAEDHSGSHYPYGFLRFLRALSEGGDPVELCRGLPFDGWRRLFCVQKMVTFGASELKTSKAFVNI